MWGHSSCTLLWFKRGTLSALIQQIWVLYRCWVLLGMEDGALPPENFVECIGWCGEFLSNTSRETKMWEQINPQKSISRDSKFTQLLSYINSWNQLWKSQIIFTRSHLACQVPLASRPATFLMTGLDVYQRWRCPFALQPIWSSWLFLQQGLKTSLALLDSNCAPTLRGPMAPA